ncbi:N-acetylmuramoyl-L-alanine amidase [Terriglobus albidus]|uniref:N-acetylmuramoyl-L-alanine amidase n=1 Tax=Terriglobus albidus TaxID=1592106 RepID=UPI0021E07DA1|nr:N-acetylmuramoyl-L-alanine amidase [Terriglobus albidus]
MRVFASIRSGIVVGLCVSTLAVAAVRRKVVTVSPWQQAEQLREQLEATPEQQRTRAAYSRAMDAYRAIYHANPADMHAPGSIFAVGELLAEQGRSLNDPKSFQAALGQFEFLRKQYPGSSLRIPALLAEGIIAQNDLRDAKLARRHYDELLRRYPHSTEAQDARAGLDAIKHGDRPAPRQPVEAQAAPPVEMPQPRQSNLARIPAMPLTSGAASGSAIDPMPSSAPADTSSQKLQPVSTAPMPRHKGALAQVSGIRHWSTPDYTRVAIDLGDEVQYEAARVPNPERIFFDLHGTRLAQDLVGKNFTVTDDGFLKKIRIAQFSNDVTRVVLDVNNVTEYSAFLLPNPYRLIIDIHGSNGAGKNNKPTEVTAKQQGEGVTAKVADKSAKPVNDDHEGVSRPANDSVTEDQSLPPAPEKSVAPVSAVPSTIATKQASTREVANLSTQPGKVKATSAPTTQPIAASVRPVEVAVNDLPAPPAADKKQRKGKKIAAADEPIGHIATPTAAGETSLVRALGLKIGRIVIDAGHGGHDSGTIGVDGLMEKDVVLDVALRLGKLLHDRLGAEIVYTRSDDTFIPLETRTAIANKAQADLFLSIHANSSRDDSARGVETYYLNFTSQPDALEVAARENAVSNQSISQLSDLVKKITLKDKIEESREFAFDVEQSLYSGLQKGNDGLKNRGIKKAPFVVLIGANMPSILTEISFVTNPRDASQLRQPDYRERIAESIYKGVARYTSGLSGMKLADANGGGPKATGN